MAQVLTFKIANRVFALSTDAVVQVVRAVEVNGIKNCAPAVTGSFNYRGILVTLVDPAVMCSMEKKPVKPSQCFIIVKADRKLFALKADEALSLVQEPNPNECLPKQVSGLVEASDGMYLINDIVQFLRPYENWSVSLPIDSAKD